MTSTATEISVKNALLSRLERASRLLLATFAAVPDDKLDFKPSETANSAREIIKHVIGGNGYIAGFMGVAQPPTPETESREDLMAAYESGANAILDHTRSLPDDGFGRETDFFGGKMPLWQVLFAQEWHICRHAAQIDYLETIWGDLEDHAM